MAIDRFLRSAAISVWLTFCSALPPMEAKRVFSAVKSKINIIYLCKKKSLDIFLNLLSTNNFLFSRKTMYLP